MRKVFWDDPYQSDLKTKVANVIGVEILFDATIGFSFSGGQESDDVWVNDQKVLASRMEGPLIYYTFDENHGFEKGQSVLMRIDGERRLALMRLHFAAELILEIVTQKWGFERMGAHIAAHKARIDFKAPQNIAPLFPEILAAYNAIIDANLSIEKGFSDEKTGRRYWKIEGFAVVPCGGTHVNTTKEVGFVTLKRKRSGKGIERIEICVVE